MAAVKFAVSSYSSQVWIAQTISFQLFYFSCSVHININELGLAILVSRDMYKFSANTCNLTP